MKLREAKRLVKRWAFTMNEITDRPICHVTMEMQYGDFPVRATGTAICQPEDDWNEAAGIGRARQKAIAQLVQQVMTLDGIEQKRAAVTLTRLKEMTAHTPFNEAMHSEPTLAEAVTP
jgi:transposase